MVKNIIIILLVLVLGIGLGGRYLSFSFGCNETASETITVDTLHVNSSAHIPPPEVSEQSTSIHLPIGEVREQITSVTIAPYRESRVYPIDRDSIIVKLKHRKYIDTIRKDNFSFAYDIEVAGFLKSFDYDMMLPLKTITRTTTKTVKKKSIFSTHIVAGVAQNPYLGIDLSLSDHKFGIRRDVLSNGLAKHWHLEYGYRIANF